MIIRFTDSKYLASKQFRALKSSQEELLNTSDIFINCLMFSVNHYATKLNKTSPYETDFKADDEQN